MPDEKGLMKIGEIKYTRNPENYFFQFLWFALRGGVADVVGFPRELPNK
jgi:catalase